MNKQFTYSNVTLYTLSLFLSVIVKAIVFVNYSLDIKGYTEEYCENIQVSESNCNGTCHLSKELKINSSEKELTNDEVNFSIVSIFSFQQLNELPTKIWIKTTNSNSFIRELTYLNSFISSVFKPPCFS